MTCMPPEPRLPLVFAGVGDVHGRHQQMVQMVQRRRTSAGEVAFVLQVGDFECHRHELDLATMAAPQKHRALGDFHRYHNGELRYPWPVYFIGGNHECYGWLDRHPRGFWPIPQRCCYLGRVGQAEILGVRVLGLSGVHDEQALGSRRPTVEQFGSRSNKDYVSFCDHEIEAAAMVQEVEVMMVHEWPDGVVSDADSLRIHNSPKVRRRGAGNPWAWDLVAQHRPALLLCGHTHLRYRRILEWDDGRRTLVCCLGAIKDGEEAVALFSWDGEHVMELD